MSAHRDCFKTKTWNHDDSQFWKGTFFHSVFLTQFHRFLQFPGYICQFQFLRNVRSGFGATWWRTCCSWFPSVITKLVSFQGSPSSYIRFVANRSVACAAAAKLRVVQRSSGCAVWWAAMRVSEGRKRARVEGQVVSELFGSTYWES